MLSGYLNLYTTLVRTTSSALKYGNIVFLVVCVVSTGNALLGWLSNQFNLRRQLKKIKINQEYIFKIKKEK